MATANTVFSTTSCYDCGDRLTERDGEALHTSYSACPGYMPDCNEYADGRESDEYRIEMRSWNEAANRLASDTGEKSQAEKIAGWGEIVSFDPRDYCAPFCTRKTRQGQCNTMLGSSGRCYNAQYHLFDQS